MRFKQKSIAFCANIFKTGAQNLLQNKIRCAIIMGYVMPLPFIGGWGLMSKQTNCDIKAGSPLPQRGNECLNIKEEAQWML